MTDWLVGRAERKYPDIDIHLNHLRKYIPPIRSDVDYPRMCAQLGATLKANTVIFGHTHELGEWEYDGIQVYNTGTWCGGRSDYLEYNHGTYTLGSWRDNAKN